MQLTGIILFVGSLIALILWARSMYYKNRYRLSIEFTEEQKTKEYIKGALIYFVLAISAGMAWG